MLIVRYSEIGIKGRHARNDMERILIRNIEEGFNRVGSKATVKRSFGRIYVDSYDDENKIKDVLSRTFGIKSFSQATVIQFKTKEEIVNHSVEEFSDLVNGKTFAVDTRRIGTHDFSSLDISKDVGSALVAYSNGVDLNNPEIRINIEIRDNKAYFFTEKYDGPGGLPLGSEGKLCSLVSGGIDSPVATWLLMKRGSPVDVLFCSLAHPVDTIDFINSIQPLFEKWGHGYDPRIHILNCRKLVPLLTDKKIFKYPNVVYKRILYLLAQRIAKKSGANGIITGESLGQVSSQTPENLRAINHSIDMPILRPLIGFDKDDIVSLARNIGTFPVSTNGEFCSLFSENPVTRILPEILDEEMKNFTILDELIELDEVIRFSQLYAYKDTISDKGLSLSHIPSDAVFIDLRNSDRYEKWHYDGAEKISLREVSDFVEEKGKDKVYVLYCQQGLQSAYVASELKNKGIIAYFTDEQKLKKLSEDIPR